MRGSDSEDTYNFLAHSPRFHDERKSYAGRK